MDRLSADRPDRQGLSAPRAVQRIRNLLFELMNQQRELGDFGPSFLGRLEPGETGARGDVIFA